MSAIDPAALAHETVRARRAAAPALPFGLTKQTLAYSLLLLAAVVILWRANVAPVLFADGGLEAAMRVLAPLVLIAAFVERAVEVVLTPTRGDGSERLQARVAAARAEGFEDEAARLELALADYRRTSRRYAFAVSATLSLTLALLGVRAVEGLLAQPAGPMLRDVDVVLTGLLLSGGADGIHKIVKGITDTMERVSRKSRA